MLKVGTRGSPLALAMTAQVVESLERLGLRCEIVTIRTHGDRHPDSPTRALGAGAFVKDLEVALTDGRIDLAVHSAKDLHNDATPGVVVAAFLPREDPRDVLVTRDGVTLGALPSGAVIGTDSPRRRAFLLAARHDLLVRGIRGNVDTRLRKLGAGEVDAVVLAAAGLVRLGLLQRAVERLDPSIMLPAVGQGAIAVQTRTDAHGLRRRLEAVDHLPTHAAVEAERAFVGALGGTCQTAIAALGTSDGQTLTLDGAVLDPDGTRMVRDTATGPAVLSREIGAELGARLLARGARSLMVEVAP
ncbi:MAG: hydroxymethylbilane synthase [Armatimonadetes bacterium]|nr:hydroxymethylbilane synthase [Armatimonadota bacterium]